LEPSQLHIPPTTDFITVYLLLVTFISHPPVSPARSNGGRDQPSAINHQSSIFINYGWGWNSLWICLCEHPNITKKQESISWMRTAEW